MVDRAENQGPKPEVDPVKTEASKRSIDDAYSRLQAAEGSPETSSILGLRGNSDAATTPVKPTDSGFKPEPGAVIPPKDTKVSPGDVTPARVEPQSSRDAVTPTNHPVEKVVDPSTKPGMPTRAGEQPNTPTDGVVPRVEHRPHAGTETSGKAV